MMTELPIVVVDVQRGGPSTGLPTKTEQSDLLQSMYGRNGESPVIVIAASTPANCFDFAYEASRLALEHMTPVVLLSDGYIANGSAPWKIKSVDEMDEIKPPIMNEDTQDWHPYSRDEKSLARTWAIPGTKGLEHRLGGLEKDAVSGDVSYVPENHEAMTTTRAEKIKRVENYIPLLESKFAEQGDLLVIGWGGTYGTIYSAVKKLASSRYDSIGFAHFNYINPMPKNTAEVLSKFKKILVCELNNGQFASILKINFPGFKFEQFNKIQGLPFGKSELEEVFIKHLS
jgi:2-oxoglutarate ferredoxin oxidoreductase subunit alpha